MILLDTNLISELMKSNPHPGVTEWVDDLPESALFVSTITRAEIELGIALLPAGRRKQSIAGAAQLMFEQFADRCLVFGETAAIQYGQLIALRKNAGRPISVEDAQIASIALANGLRLATRNLKDFEEIPGSVTVSPWLVEP